MSYGKVLSDIWANRDFIALNPHEQQLYMLLLSYPTRNHAGVLPLTLRRWAGATATATPESVRTALMHLADTRFVVLDWDTEEVLVRTYIRNDELYRQPKVMKCALREALEIASLVLRAAVSNELRSLPKHADEQRTADVANQLVEGFSRGIGGVSEGYVDSQGVGVGYVSTHAPTTENPATGTGSGTPVRRPMDLATQIHGHPIRPEPPPPDYGPNYADAMDLVATIVGRHHPEKVRADLVREVRKLLDERIGAPKYKAYDVVDLTLHRWMTRQLSPGQLSMLGSDVIKELDGQLNNQLGGADKKRAGWDELGKRRMAQREMAEREMAELETELETKELE